MSKRGTKEFEQKLAKTFDKYKPELSPDYSLLTISSAYFRRRTFVDNAIDSYEQGFEAIARMIPTQFKYTIQGRTMNGDKIGVTMWYDNIEYIPPNEIREGFKPLPATPALAIATGKTYGCHVKGDFHATMFIVETVEDRRKKLRELISTRVQIAAAREEVHLKAKTGGGAGSKNVIDPSVKVEDLKDRINVHYPGSLKSVFPIMVGSKYCRLSSLRDKPETARMLGEDPNDPGGYMVLEGNPITCGSVYTHTPNSPMSMLNEKDDIDVFSTVMSRRDPFFGNTYQTAPTITRDKVDKNKSLIQQDVVIEIMWNQPDMNAKEVGSSKKHLSRVPIFALFRYYGCETHSAMRDFIFPGVGDDDPRVQLLIDATTNGKYHLELYKREKPVTQRSALQHIGYKILSSDAHNKYRSEAANEVDSFSNEFNMTPKLKEECVQMLYEERVRTKTKTILDGTFFFNVNKDTKKVCLAMGACIAHIIGVKVRTEVPTDRTNLAFNRSQTIGEQFTSEAKKHIKHELIDPIVARLNKSVFDRFNWEGMKTAFPAEVTAPVVEAGSKLEIKIRRGFKSTSKAKGQQPRLLEERYDPKNAIFIWSKINENNIRPSIGTASTIVFSRREVHASQALFLCPYQTPEAGADVGRYHQPTIYAQLSTCSMENGIRELLGMKDTSHPSAFLGTEAESADDDDEVDL